jgi:LPS sulfotransferase NodH
MFNITKTPILILSSPRTGSTVLGSHLRTLYDVPYFREPDQHGDEQMTDFRNYFSQSKNFILKCHHIYLNRYGSDATKYLIENAYKIRIRRKNIVEQIASYYVAIQRVKFGFTHKNELNLVDTVDIDIMKIKKHIFYINYANLVLNSSTINFDLDLYYEDLPKINDAGYYVVPKPTNYNELLSIITELVASP